MKFKGKFKGLLCSILFMSGTLASAADHPVMMNHAHLMKSSNGMLTEAGNDAFGTIQEVIAQLNNDPNTDWSQVNLEALRQHLLDMQDMTLNVEVLDQRVLPQGLEVVLKATTERAEAALDRVFQAHPAQLKRETGWEMQVVKYKNQYTVSTRAKNSRDIKKIQGLGYIGWMASGNHHQPHHWAMALGTNPHGQSYQKRVEASF